MYQNRLGPSGGIYYPNFVPCFVYHQLNERKKTITIEAEMLTAADPPLEILLLKAEFSSEIAV